MCSAGANKKRQVLHEEKVLEADSGVSADEISTDFSSDEGSEHVQDVPSRRQPDRRRSVVSHIATCQFAALVTQCFGCWY